MCATPHPDVFWYYLNSMGTQKNAPKKALVLFFPYIFHIKTKWNIVYKYLKTKIFSGDTNIFPLMHWTSNIFGHSATTIRGFWVSLNYPILNFRKTVSPKNVRMWHWCVSILHNFLTSTKQEKFITKIFFQTILNENLKCCQGSTIPTNSPYVITYMYQTFGIHDVRG